MWIMTTFNNKNTWRASIKILFLIYNSFTRNFFIFKKLNVAEIIYAINIKNINFYLIFI